jgi:hypothetical protein
MRDLVNYFLLHGDGDQIIRSEGATFLAILTILNRSSEICCATDSEILTSRYCREVVIVIIIIITGKG